MKTYDVVGYTLDGEFYCNDPDCIPDKRPGETEDDMGTVYAGSEWDNYPVCASCGGRCEDVSLTADGEAYEHGGDPADTEDE